MTTSTQIRRTITQRLALLPEDERLAVEAMMFELMEIRGMGAATALEVIGAVCKLVLQEKRGKNVHLSL